MSKKPTKVEQPVTQSRVYKDKITFNHDLYRLAVSTMRRNISWNPKKPEYEPFEHKHFFHTFDSDGRQQTRCVAALGHFHPMEMKDNGIDQLPTVVCGPAMKEVMKQDDEGNFRKTSVPLVGKEQHSHEVEYVFSESLQTRKVNVEAAKAQSQIISKQNPEMTADERASIKDAVRDAGVE